MGSNPFGLEGAHGGGIGNVGRRQDVVVGRFQGVDFFDLGTERDLLQEPRNLLTDRDVVSFVVGHVIGRHDGRGRKVGGQFTSPGQGHLAEILAGVEFGSGVGGHTAFVGEFLGGTSGGGGPVAAVEVGYGAAEGMVVPLALGLLDLGGGPAGEDAHALVVVVIFAGREGGEENGLVAVVGVDGGEVDGNEGGVDGAGGAAGVLLDVGGELDGRCCDDGRGC